MILQWLILCSGVLILASRDQSCDERAESCFSPFASIRRGLSDQTADTVIGPGGDHGNAVGNGAGIAGLGAMTPGDGARAGQGCRLDLTGVTGFHQLGRAAGLDDGTAGRYRDQVPWAGLPGGKERLRGTVADPATAVKASSSWPRLSISFWLGSTASRVACEDRLVASAATSPAICHGIWPVT